MKRIRPIAVLLVSLVLACAVVPMAFADNGLDTGTAQGEAVADGNTASTWRDWGLENSTENVGRIWTDKTVQAGDITLTGAGGEKTISKGDSTFLTALSAISSTSNLRSTATVPLDIVLVLDASGSMSDAMGRTDSTKRIDALKSAANSFIEEIAKQNKGVSDTAKQHQVSIVKFAGDESNRVGNDLYRDGQNTFNYSQVMKAMTACTDDTKESFKGTIGSINPAGATRADNGMELAQQQTSNRSDAKKVVIFFTDGKPTSFSDYNPAVASAAVTTAKAMKDTGASVYTIGIFDDANPSADISSSRTSDENKFMQAASSNYPDATYTGWGSQASSYSWSFGERASDSDFYKSATDADELKRVFDDISQEITKGAGYPTDTREGFEDESGYITFTDQLGDYMQVDGFSTIVFANQVFSDPVKTTNGLVDTYTFTGEAGTTLYPNGNLRDIDITVTRSEDLQTGDKVEVKIPAALIPLRHFAVNSDGTGSVDLTFPIRVFYGSSLKAGVTDAMANPDSAMAAYIVNNSANGAVGFLANKWSGGPDGDVVANFTPSKGNSYYYITEDTPIYQDEACTQRANAPLEQGKTYYYQRTWYDIDNGKATQQTKAVGFDSGVVENIDGYISSDADGKAYFKAGTPRMTYIDELSTAKGADASHLSANNTQTANTFINPKWAGAQVNTLLGNNGKLSVALPGTLAISKTLEVPEGYSADDFANENFEFAIAIPGAANSALKAEVKNAAGEVVGSAFDIGFDKDGKATHSLKNGETLYIYNIGDGSEYTVSEVAKAGFAQTAPVDGAGAAVAAVGTIEAGKTANADFVNKYGATGTLNGEAALAGEKVLTGRDWLSGDKFTFLMKSADASAETPMPTGAVDGVARVELMQSEGTPADTPIPFNFGSITYTQPGTYIYEIHESAADSVILPGVSASGALYQVIVTVADKEHNGALTIESSMKQLKNDVGMQADQAVQVATFTNAYNAKTETWAPIGQKTYTDQTGANPLKADMFHVVVCSDDAEAPLPEGVAAMPELGGSQWRGAVTSVEASGDIVFPQATYGFIDLQGETEKTYEYKLMEVVKNPSGKWVSVKDALAASDYQRNGMRYDPSVWTAHVTIKSVDNTLELSATYEKDGVEQPGALFQFDNSYAPEPATAIIEGTKTLTGRNMGAMETFGFQLAAADKATQDAIDAGAVVLPGGESSAVATVSGASAGVPQGFGFGDLSFAKPGTYTFNVSETQWNGEALPADDTDGVTFDRSVKTVTVAVTDGHDGSLKAELAYPEGGVAFANRYHASSVSFDTANAQLKKVLEGRDWLDSDSFTFNLKALTDGAPMPEGATGGVATATVTKANADSFGFGTIAYTADMLQGASSKTFEYEVTEVKGDSADIDYATSKAVIKVTVADNGEGKLTASASTENGTFVNRYAASVSYTANGGIELAKTLNGRDMADGQFKVVVTPADEASASALGLAAGSNEFAMPAGADGQKVLKQILNDNVAFTQSDAGKTYTYTVAEVNDGTAGYAYDDTTYTVTIAVTISDAGKLTVTTTVTGGESAGTYVYTSDSAQPNPVVLAFTNSYKASGDVAISGTKTLTGRSLTAGEFGFAVKYAAGGDDLLSAKNASDGSINFGTLSYSTEMLAQLVKDGKAVKNQDGTWTVNYLAYEKTSALPNGVTAQTQPISFTVTVTDKGDGTLAATPNVGNGLKFQNAYGTDKTTVKLSGKKNLKRDAGLKPADITGKFTFTVTGEEGAPMPNRTTATNDTDGNIDFGTITFTLDDLNKAWEKQHPVTQSAVEEPAAGQTEATESAAISNEAKAADEVADTGVGKAVEGTKSVEGKASAAAEQAEGSVASDVADQKLVVSENSDGEGAVTLAAKSAEAESSATAPANKPKATDAKDAAKASEPAAQAGTPRSVTFTYKITESGVVAGVTNDTATKTVSFKVTDDGNGKLTVARVAPADESSPAFAFTNTYSVKPVSSSVTDQITVTKQLTGRDLETGEFSFELVEGSNIVATATNDAAGNVTFDALTYQKPGEHHYLLREVGAGTQQAGVQYDSTVFDVATTVTDNGDGTLSVVHKLGNGGNAAKFANTYQPASTSVVLGATKVLTGKSLAAGEFMFELTGDDGMRATAENDGAGGVSFPAQEYTEKGTYHYLISEVKGNEAGVTYDDATYPVTVTVDDNGKGTLVAAVSYDDGNAPVFHNSYEKPESPLPFVFGGSDNANGATASSAGGSSAVKTGDGALALAAVIAAVAALAIGVGALAFGRRRRR